MDIMKEYVVNPDILEDEEKTQEKRELLRTAQILLMIFEEKSNIYQENIKKVSKLENEFKKNTDMYNKLMKKFMNEKDTLSESYETLLDDNNDNKELINNLYDELSNLKRIELIYEFIDKLLKYLEVLDANDTNLQNIYLINRYPYEIEDTKKKIEILNRFLKSKSKIFKSKSNIIKALEDIDNNSACKKMININLYVEKQKNEVIEKYSNCLAIDKKLLGDYLTDFEKLDIRIPKIIPKSNTIKKINKEDLIKLLQSSYDKLNKKEKSACHVASSFLRNLLDVLVLYNNEKNINKIIEQLEKDNKLEMFTNSFNLLDNYINAKVRVKYFSIVKINSLESFIESLLEVIDILNNINFTIDKYFYGYYLENKELVTLLKLKNTFNLGDKLTNIAKINNNVNIYYSPVKIIKPIDIIDNSELLIQEGDIIFILKNNLNVNILESNIKVAQYGKFKINKYKNYVSLGEMRKKNICRFNIQSIESIKKGE